MQHQNSYELRTTNSVLHKSSLSMSAMQNFTPEYVGTQIITNEARHQILLPCIM